MTVPTAALIWLLGWRLPYHTLEFVTALGLAALAVFVSYWSLWHIRRLFLNRSVEPQGKSILVTELWAVVANAGVPSLGYIEWQPMSRIQYVFEVNTFGVIRVARAFLPLMRKTPGSRLVVVTSLLGRMSMPASMTYCMSKHASTSLADSLRRQYYDRGVHVSTVEPGAYRTPMANHDTMAKTLRKDLSLLPPRVRDVISDHSLGSLRKSSDTLYASIMRDDLQEAVDVMKSAVRDLIPKAYYRAGGFKDILLRRLYEVAPAEVTDEFVHMIRKVARAARRKA
ncbi:retinol dehydrogenase 7 [Dermacentor silvarum]|uniref:retinol dehydrogenase 7 n=1 Tax=Dermacentor silvarum TaxID=543639 RepID=UPI00189BA36C|nr:retinol dehydrogenase 7 [Dermacentor silvarum]